MRKQFPGYSVVRLISTFSLVIATVLLFSSCASKKDILYMQDIETLATTSNKQYSSPTIKPNDLLIITVSAFDVESVEPFNLLLPGRVLQQQQNNPANNHIQGYLVSTDGTIEFPVIGTVQAGGLNRQELIDKLKKEISAYVVNPIVNITITNYKITVLGEVARPGTYTVADERITLLEALGMAGDLTILGKRENILILREKEGIKVHEKVDITKSDFLNSPYYYLQQNDIVYVHPNSARISASAIYPNISVYLSVASFLTTLIVVLTR